MELVILRLPCLPDQSADALIIKMILCGGLTHSHRVRLGALDLPEVAAVMASSFEIFLARNLHGIHGLIEIESLRNGVLGVLGGLLLGKEPVDVHVELAVAGIGVGVDFLKVERGGLFCDFCV